MLIDIASKIKLFAVLQVAVGHIVSGGAADLDGRIRSGDEIISVDGISVLKASHRQVVQLMNAAANRGQVNLLLRRRIFSPVIGPPYPNCTPWSSENQLVRGPPHVPVVPVPSFAQTYDITVQRQENEGFGFVIISSVNKVGSTIGL